MIENLDQAIERLYYLNVGVVGTGPDRHERPHKPLLLLAVFDLLDEGLATPDHIPWRESWVRNKPAKVADLNKIGEIDTPNGPQPLAVAVIGEAVADAAF